MLGRQYQGLGSPSDNRSPYLNDNHTSRGTPATIERPIDTHLRLRTYKFRWPTAQSPLVQSNGLHALIYTGPRIRSKNMKIKPFETP
jgi:hypothetical protein